MNLSLPARMAAWLGRPQHREQAPVRLSQRRIYILPSRNGLLLGVTLSVMLLGCINYNLGLGYVLTFLLAGVGVVTLLHTFRNLTQLQVSPGRAEPVFMGEEAQFCVLLHNTTSQARFAICVSVPDTSGLAVPGNVADWRDLAPNSTTAARLHIVAHERGRLHLPRLRIHTTFPLGLFYAWSNVYLDTSCVVYPRPEPGVVPAPPAAPGNGAGREMTAGQDDFAGLRDYHPGDSARHVAWKVLARGQSLVTKQFVAPGAGDLWLRWDDLPSGMRVEARLSRMTRWVLDAAGAQVRFGLDIPGMRVAPDSGTLHQERCLTALALFRTRG